MNEGGAKTMRWWEEQLLCQWHFSSDGNFTSRGRSDDVMPRSVFPATLQQRTVLERTTPLADLCFNCPVTIWGDWDLCDGLNERPAAPQWHFSELILNLDSVARNFHQFCDLPFMGRRKQPQGFRLDHYQRGHTFFSSSVISISDNEPWWRVDWIP